MRKIGKREREKKVGSASNQTWAKSTEEKRERRKKKDKKKEVALPGIETGSTETKGGGGGIH